MSTELLDQKASVDESVTYMKATYILIVRQQLHAKNKIKLKKKNSLRIL